MFRRLVREIGALMVYEVTRDLPLTLTPIDTPLEAMRAPTIAGRKLCIVSVLRAGNGLLEGMLDIIPSARIGHLGMARDEVTLRPSEYYMKLPKEMDRRLTIVVDPMLATGNSACAAMARLKQAGAGSMRFVCLLAAPEGLSRFSAAHPDVPVFTAAIDRELDANGYIRPGLGDAGDRLHGTKG
jgi:uracil phosphoribosyltransferase